MDSSRQRSINYSSKSLPLTSNECQPLGVRRECSLIQSATAIPFDFTVFQPLHAHDGVQLQKYDHVVTRFQRHRPFIGEDPVRRLG